MLFKRMHILHLYLGKSMGLSKKRIKHQKVVNKRLQSMKLGMIFHLSHIVNVNILFPLVIKLLDNYFLIYSRPPLNPCGFCPTEQESR